VGGRPLIHLGVAKDEVLEVDELALVSLSLPDFNRKKACFRKCLRANKGVIFI
jgi:hypothetical protein